MLTHGATNFGSNYARINVSSCIDYHLLINTINEQPVATFAASDSFFKEAAARINEVAEIKFCKKRLSKIKDSLRFCQAPILDRPLKCISLPGKGNLQTNLRLAHKLLVETTNSVRFSPNYLGKSEKIIKERYHINCFEKDKIFPKLSDKAWKCLNSLREFSKKEHFLQKGHVFTEDKIRAQVTNVMSIGNCGEMSRVAFFKAMEKGVWNTQIELAYIVNGDHYFLVIGRDPDSDINDYKTWGSSAVILDAWLQIVFEASEIETRLMDYKSFDKATGLPELKSFDPRSQKIEIFNSNILTVKELSDFIMKRARSNNEIQDVLLYVERIRKLAEIDTEQKNLFGETVKNLKSFHETQILQEKLTFAISMQELCSNEKIALFSKIKHLKEQIDHFIEFSHGNSLNL